MLDLCYSYILVMGSKHTNQYSYLYQPLYTKKTLSCIHTDKIELKIDTLNTYRDDRMYRDTQTHT